MRCQEVRCQVEAYCDGQLDLVRHVEVEKHLIECAECAEQERHLRSLRAAIASPSLYHRAPAALRARVQLATPSVTRGRRRTSVRLAAAVASVLLLIGAAATIGIFLSQARNSTDDRFAERVVASHVRSLQQVDHHLTDVPSSDQHTVKPWFHGKLDFSPQVPDLSAQGYVLSGGRLDYLADRPVAALVYYRRLHAINVFTWPAVNNDEKGVRALARQGFHMRHWQRSGMTYWAISDLNDQEFDEFVREFQAKGAPLTP